jgi:hypothetical protein
LGRQTAGLTQMNVQETYLQELKARGYRPDEAPSGL